MLKLTDLHGHTHIIYPLPPEKGGHVVNIDTHYGILLIHQGRSEFYIPFVS